MLWIRIRIGSDPHNFAGSRSVSIQVNEKVDKVDYYPENFNVLSKILKTYETFDTDEKDKRL